MTHDELKDLLAGYAIDALADEETIEIAQHLASCVECRAELRTFQEAVDMLADAVPQLVAPERIRARVLLDAPFVPPRANVPEVKPTAWRFPHVTTPSSGFWTQRGRQVSRRIAPLAAVLAVVVLSVTTVNVLHTTRDTQQELVEDRAALGLLTSTETENDLLSREASELPSDAHGHWFHRPGVTTQVVVGERLPAAPPGQRYVVWMELPTGWTAIGDLQPDDSGYGRLVVLGFDGTLVRAVEITRETQRSARPGPQVMLRSQPVAE